MEKMTLVKATLIQSGCTYEEELRHITPEKRKEIAAALQKNSAEILEIVTLQECNDLLRFMVGEAPETDTVTAFHKLIRLLDAQ